MLTAADPMPCACGAMITALMYSRPDALRLLATLREFDSYTYPHARSTTVPCEHPAHLEVGDLAEHGPPLLVGVALAAENREHAPCADVFHHVLLSRVCYDMREHNCRQVGGYAV